MMLNDAHKRVKFHILSHTLHAFPFGRVQFKGEGDISLSGTVYLSLTIFPPGLPPQKQQNAQWRYILGLVHKVIL